jgi:uroporphyrinogen-III decarboxylase
MAPSNKELFLKLFRGEAVDRVLCVFDLTYWRDAQIMQESLPEEYRGNEGFLKLHLDLGVMPYYIYAYAIDDAEHSGGVSVHQIGGSGKPFNGVFGLRFEGVEIDATTTGNTTLTRFHLGGRTLEQRKAYLPRSFCYSFQEYPVKTPEDLRTLRAIVERYDFYSTSEDYRFLAHLWGGHGVPIAAAPRSPISALVTDWMGATTFVFAEADYPEEIRKTLDCIGQANEAGFHLILSSEAEVFHFCDNLNAALYASYFDRYMAEYYARRFRQLHSHGKKAAVHIDGTIIGLLRQIAAAGADAAEALTPKPVGDLDVRDFRRVADNPRIILWGGLPGSMFSTEYGADQMHAQVEAVIQGLGSNRPFIAGIADQLPPDADLDYVRDAVRTLTKMEVSI